MTDLNLGAAQQDFTIDQGTRVELPFTLAIDGSAVVWSGYTASLVVDAPTPLALDESDGITLGPSNGAGTIVLTDAQTTDLPAGAWPYYFKVTNSDGQDYPLLRGRILVRAV